MTDAALSDPAPADPDAAEAPLEGALGWFGIFRVGLIQLALGSIVVLTTSTLNRVMVVELGLLATLPGALVGLHYAIQILRPRWGYGSDVGGRRTPWIIGGMAVLAAGGILAAAATALMAANLWAGVALATLAFTLIGGGVGAAGTSVLVFLAVRVSARRRAAAATIVWLMMIAGLAITATVAGGFLDPFSNARLIGVVSVVCLAAVALTIAAIAGMEGRTPAAAAPQPADQASEQGFLAALGEVWREPQARHFTIFVFVSMLAYSAQDLVLEPFAGAVFGMTPGESTKLAGMQHGGVFLGMILVAVCASGFGRGRFGSMRAWAIGGCIASAFVLAALSVAGSIGPGFPLRTTVFLLGLANGAFAVAAIGSMMGLVRQGKEKREGTRMGLWGAAQGIAFGVGGFAGTVVLDGVRLVSTEPQTAFAAVFALEAALFIVSAVLAAGVKRTGRDEALGMSGAAPGEAA
jgi:BCD family chlorophyll transporter-like MFS transporter